VGSSENTAIAGLGGQIGGQDAVLWAGKSGNEDAPSNYHFVMRKDGTMDWYDTNGNAMMYIYPALGMASINKLSVGTIYSQTGEFYGGEIHGKFRTEVPLANNVKALPRMFVPVWIGRVYFNNNQYHSSYSYRAQVEQYSGEYDSFDITVGWLGGEGQCSVVFDYPFSAADDYFVTFQGSALDKNWACFACIQEKRNNGFFALAADDNTPENLNFYMQIWARTT